MKRAVCLISTVGVGILAGCGGGDSTPETSITPTVQTPSKLSKADFIQQADGYCAELNAALGATADSTTTGANGLEPRADLYQGLLNHLHGLGTPDDDAGLDDFFSAGDDVVAAEESLETAQSDGDATTLASAESDAASAEARFASAASAYGFNECGQGPTTPSSSTPSAPATSVPTTPAAPVTTTPAAPATPPGTTGAGGGTAGTGTGTGTGGGSTGTGGSTGSSGGVGPG